MKQKQLILPPRSQQELMDRCQQLAGRTLGNVASERGLKTPENLMRHKGWVGTLLEQVLGASAGNRAEPDFIDLGIEMKTLPLNALGEPKESTYVCTVSMQQSGEMSWQDSWVKRKLSHVLWVPVEADKTIPLAERYIGQAWLWRPSNDQEIVLERDWSELMDRIVLGEQSEISGKEGEYLHIRPKAANSSSVAAGISASGEVELINPKGFYLRTSFTKQLLIYMQNNL
jgi:DNA mismatch repair protein MutH